MTASSSNDDLADLLGNLADNDESIDEDVLAEIDGAAALAQQSAAVEKEPEPSTDTDGNADEEVVDAEPEDGASGDEAVFVAEADDSEEPAEEDAATEVETENATDDYADALAAAVGGESVPEESEAAAQFADVMGTSDQHETTAPAAIAATPTHRRRVSKVSKGDALKATMAPILLTVGLLVLLPAIWGTMLLLGMDVFMSERSNAKTMATFMMVCWPIAVALIATAIVLFLQVSKAKKKAAARAEY